MPRGTVVRDALNPSDRDDAAATRALFPQTPTPGRGSDTALGGVGPHPKFIRHKRVRTGRLLRRLIAQTVHLHRVGPAFWIALYDVRSFHLVNQN